MKITISGDVGSGKSSVAKLIAEKYKLKHYSAGDFARKLAKKKRITILELSKKAEQDKEIDKEIDASSKELANKDNFILDGRMGFFFIPNSTKIFLKTKPEIAAKRIFKQKRKEEKEDVSLKETIKAVKRRSSSERKRYEKYYNLDYTNKKHYDLVIDTGNKTIKETLEEIVKYFKEHKP
ncbi:cytidylate kinase family protein [Candidatus Woesearchaeota archaeon]|nr:cytidylate kinase family protein [Candidatus Woesearchaeota archaeon]